MDVAAVSHGQENDAGDDQGCVMDELLGGMPVAFTLHKHPARADDGGPPLPHFSGKRVHAVTDALEGGPSWPSGGAACLFERGARS